MYLSADEKGNLYIDNSLLAIILDDLTVLTAGIAAGAGDGGQEHTFFILIHDVL